MRFLLFFALAASALAQSPEDQAWQTLERALKDPNPIKRSSAVLAMGVTLPARRSVDLVESALADKDLGVRRSACATLGGYKSKSSLRKLIDALNDPAPEVVLAAAKALYDMGDPAGRQVLIAVLDGDRASASGAVSSSVRDAKLKLHDPKALLLLGVNSGAGAFIGPLGAGLPVAESLLKDNQASGKTVAALLLATDNSTESKDALTEALSDKNWTVRAAATRAIALRDIRGLFDTVVPLLADKQPEVQYSAAAAVIRLRQPAR
jgi:HEAT repeat protein